MGELLQLRAYCERRWDLIAEEAAETEEEAARQLPGDPDEAVRHDHLEQLLEFLAAAPMS